jgi:hypothetical protein
MDAMRPATSGRSVTDSSERRLPTAVIVCGSAMNPTFSTSTVTAGPAADAPLAAAPGVLLAATTAGSRFAPNQ